jgi:hypothetical protein
LVSGVLLLAALGACSPSLNWREVQLGRLRTLLPCKPDSASRPVQLGGQTLAMEMKGCEAGGVLFAISRVQATDPAQAPALLQALRLASLQNVHMRTVKPVANSGDGQSSLDLLADGQRTDGSPLQARFKWLLAGAEVYQIAAYAEHLTGEQTDNMVSEMRLQ